MLRQQEINRVQAAAIIAAGGVYAWLLTHPQNFILSYAYYLVPALLLLCALHTGESTLRIMLIARYLRLIEEAAFGADKNLPGWEHYKGERNGIAILSSSGMAILWAVMIIGSLVLAGKLRIHANPSQPGLVTQPQVPAGQHTAPAP